MVCHSCRAEAQKFGFFIGTNKERIQRYRCKQCRKTFGDIPERPLDSLYTSIDKAARVVHLLVEGVGVRACERLTGTNRNTVLRILETVGTKLTLQNKRDIRARSV